MSESSAILSGFFFYNIGNGSKPLQYSISNFRGGVSQHPMSPDGSAAARYSEQTAWTSIPITVVYTNDANS